MQPRLSRLVLLLLGGVVLLGFAAQFASRELHQAAVCHSLIGQGLVGLALFVSMFVAAIWSIPRMHGLQRNFWIVLVLTLFVGLLPRTWDYSKPLWFVLSVAAAHSALVGRRGFRGGVEHESLVGLGRHPTAAVRVRAQV